MAGDFASLAIVVVNYGSSALLEQNLVPLARAAVGARVVVVDNLTTDEERRRVSQIAARQAWELVLPTSNTGFGVGMNLGVERAREAGATSFLLLNPDATITAANVEILIRKVEAQPMTLISPRILRPDGSTWFGGSDLYLDDGRIRSASRRTPTEVARIQPWLSGACLLITEVLWQRVGGFSDEYFLYWEDVDLSHRVVQLGGALEVCGDAVAVHAEGGTQSDGHASSGGAKSTVYYYYNIRNRLLFVARNLPTEDVRRWRRSTVPIAYEILLQGGRRQFLRSLRPVGAAIRGIRDGSRIVRRELRDRVLSGRP